MSGEHQFLHQSPPRTEGAQRRAEPIELVIAGDTKGAASLWKEVPPESLSAAESLLYAIACVDSASPEAAAAIDRVRAFHALEAEALHAVHLQRQDKFDESIQALHKVLVAMRDDPTPHPFVLRPCLAMIPVLVKSQPRGAPVLIEGLERPFSLMAFEEQRLGTVAQLATYLVPQSGVRAVAMLEPHVPWNVDYLALRARVYRQADDPRAALAEADLAEFLSREPDRRVLPPGSK